MTVEYDMFEGRVWKNLVSSKGHRKCKNIIRSLRVNIHVFVNVYLIYIFIYIIIMSVSLCRVNVHINCDIVCLEKY